MPRISRKLVKARLCSAVEATALGIGENREVLSPMSPNLERGRLLSRRCKG
jgi:hypothetical protein